jgi:hypothetical protein
MTESYLNELESRRDRLVANIVAAVDDPARLRSLLAEVEDVPDGWRALASRLLEERVFEAEFGALLGESQPLASPQVGPSLGRSRSIGTKLATAVVLLICGWVGGHFLTGPQHGERAGVRTPDFLGRDLSVRRSATDDLETENGIGESPSVPGDAVPPLPATLDVVLNERDGRSVTVPNVPVVADPDLSLLEKLTSNTSVSESARELLLRSGRTIRETQTIVPVQLPNGGMGLMPVFEWQIEPAAERSFL